MFLLLLLSCTDDERVSGTTSDTETGTAMGKLVLEGGAAVVGARVTLLSSGEDSGKAGSAGRTAFTDAGGIYRFDSLPFDSYNLTALYVPDGTRDTLAASRMGIEVTGLLRHVQVGVDTLKGPGAVSARVLFLANPVEEALCFVPGTSYMALTDPEGRCLVSGIPPGRYRLSFKADGYLTARAPDSIRVATDDTIRLGDIRLQLDDRSAPPKPTGLGAVFDSATRTVSLSWSRVPSGDLAGYALYRDSVAAVNFTRLTPDRLEKDTLYVDSLPGLKPGSDTLLAYRIKSQDRSGEQSGFALFDTVRVRLVRGNSAPTTPFAPRPLDGSGGAALTLTLQWKSRDADGDPIRADVYLGKQDPPLTRVGRAVSDSFLVVQDLDSLATYYWRVSVTDGRDTVAGPVWSFQAGTKPAEGWKRLATPLFQPTDMWFIDKHRGWMSGARGEIVYTPDGGYTWFPQASGDTGWIAAIQFSDSLNGWAVGEGGMILRTRNGGAAWTRVPNPGGGRYHDVFFLDARTGWVVGFKDNFGLTAPVVLKTEDGGATWRNQPVEDALSIQCVRFIDQDVGFLAGDWYSAEGVAYKTVDGGEHWDKLDSVGLYWPYALDFIDADTGWIGGTSPSQQGLVARTVDGGRHWTVSEVPGSTQIASLGFEDGGTGWATGSQVHRTADGGRTWQIEDTGHANYFVVYFHLDREHGWAAGTDGALYKRPPLPKPGSAAPPRTDSSR